MKYKPPKSEPNLESSTVFPAERDRDHPLPAKPEDEREPVGYLTVDGKVEPFYRSITPEDVREELIQIIHKHVGAGHFATYTSPMLVGIDTAADAILAKFPNLREKP